MTNFYAFNGDADGLCALQQLRLADAAPAELITGVKRDIELLQRVPAKAGDCVTVLDVSLEGGGTDVERVDVASGKPARWMTASDLANKFFSCCGQDREHAPTRALFDQARQLAGAASLRPLHTALTESLALAVDASGGAR